METRTISIEEIKQSGIDSWSVKDNSNRGYTTKYTSELVIGDKVVSAYYVNQIEKKKGEYTAFNEIENYFTLITA